MIIPIPLALLSLWGVWGIVTSTPRVGKEPLPWWAWTNITAPVVALNPEELPYQKPSATSRANRVNVRHRQRPRAPPSLLRTPVLQRPTTNVSDSAASLRFYVCCVCLPEYACVDGYTSMKKLNPDDYSLNYEVCPYHSDVCCPVVNAPASCQREKNRSVKRSVENPPAITAECECLQQELCPPDLVVRFSPNDALSPNSVNCSNEYEVCCSLSDLPMGGKGGEGDVLSSDNCICMEETICDIMVHLLGIKSQDYLSYVQNHTPKRSCSKSSHVCCSLPSTLPTTDDGLLFQTPAVEYKDDANCYGYFISEQIPVSRKSVTGDVYYICS